MKDEKDVRGLRSARAELSKRGIDTTRADVRVVHGVLQIRGKIGIARSSAVSDLRSEMELIARVLRSKPEIRDVVLDCTY